MIQDLPSLHTVSNPVSTVVCMYMLTGCDYVSSFFKHTKTKFVECLFSNIQYILSTNSLIHFVGDGHGHKVFDTIHTESWLNLVCSPIKNTWQLLASCLHAFTRNATMSCQDQVLPEPCQESLDFLASSYKKILQD